MAQKMLRIADDTYDLLVKVAKEQGRSIANMADYAIQDWITSGRIDEDRREQHVVKEIITKEGEDLELIPLAQLPRDREIVREINELQKKLDDKDEMNQDPDYWERMRAIEKNIQDLWAEWHEVTGR